LVCVPCASIPQDSSRKTPSLQEAAVVTLRKIPRSLGVHAQSGIERGDQMSSCGKPDGQKDKSDRSGIPTLSQNQRRMGSLCRGPGTPPAITPSHNSVVNCLFHDVACPEAESRLCQGLLRNPPRAWTAAFRPRRRGSSSLR
jgi:hypothetical protein